MTDRADRPELTTGVKVGGCLLLLVVGAGLVWVALAVLTPNGPTAEDVYAELAAAYPAPHPRDNTEFCAGSGCLQLITSDAVNVYQWRGTTAARRYANGLGGEMDARRVGPFVLRFDNRGTQATTPAPARAAYVDAARHVLADG